VLHSSQNHLRTITRNLFHPIVCRCRKHRQLTCQEGIFVAFFSSGCSNGSLWMSLSLRRSNSGAAFMGSTRSGSPSPRWAMIEEVIKELHMVSSREGDSRLPSLGRCGTGALPTPITTMPWMENAPAIQVMMMVPPWTAAPQPDSPLSNGVLVRRGNERKPVLGSPAPSRRQRNGGTSLSVSKQLP
jgi:hypothetical protein